MRTSVKAAQDKLPKQIQSLATSLNPGETEELRVLPGTFEGV